MPGGSLGIIGWSGLRRKLLFHFVQHHLLILFPLIFSFHFHPLFYFLFCSSDSLGLFEGEVDEVFEVDGFSAVGIGEGTQVGTGIVVIAQEWRKEEVLGGRGELIHNNCSTIHTLPPKHTGSAIKPKQKGEKCWGNFILTLFRYIVSIMQYLNRFLYVQRGGNQQNLIQSTTQKHHDIVRNRLLLASLFNFGTFLVLVFSMSYYDWGKIEIPFYVLNEEHSQEVVRGDLTLFFNLLYGKQLNVPYYQSYSQISKEVCLPNDIFCQSIFQELFCLGLLCFIVMGVGSAFQVYDIAMVVQELCGMRKVVAEEQADTLRYFVAIGHYLVGVTLNIFGLYLMQVEVFLGVSFWVFVGGVGLFVAVVIAQQVSLNHLRKQKLILDLMKGEKKMSNHLNTITIELSEESDAYI